MSASVGLAVASHLNGTEIVVCVWNPTAMKMKQKFVLPCSVGVWLMIELQKAEFPMTNVRKKGFIVGY